MSSKLFVHQGSLELTLRATHTAAMVTLDLSLWLGVSRLHPSAFQGFKPEQLKLSVAHIRNPELPSAPAMPQNNRCTFCLFGGGGQGQCFVVTAQTGFGHTRPLASSRGLRAQAGPAITWRSLWSSVCSPRPRRRRRRQSGRPGSSSGTCSNTQFVPDSSISARAMRKCPRFIFSNEHLSIVRFFAGFCAHFGGRCARFCTQFPLE